MTNDDFEAIGRWTVANKKVRELSDRRADLAKEIRSIFGSYEYPSHHLETMYALPVEKLRELFERMIKVEDELTETIHMMNESATKAGQPVCKMSKRAHS